MNPERSKSKNDRTMPMIHPNAAAIDIGATMHTAAVRADRTPEPIRSFGTFTTDLHRLVDWFTECGDETVVMESTSVYWIPIFELLDAVALLCSSSMPAMPSTYPDARPMSATRSGCKRCGRKLTLRHTGMKHHIPRYSCSRAWMDNGGPHCIAFGGLRVDDAIEEAGERRDQVRDALSRGLEAARYAADGPSGKRPRIGEPRQARKKSVLMTTQLACEATRTDEAACADLAEFLNVADFAGMACQTQSAKSFEECRRSLSRSPP
jgi:hypothetical protein